MPDSSEDFEPYQILKRGAQKLRDVVGSKLSSSAGVKTGPAKQRTPEEIAAARKEAGSRATDIQNIKAYNRSIQTQPGAQKMIEPYEGKKFEERKPIRKLPSRSSSR
jgi:hypothetical protein